MRKHRLAERLLSDVIGLDWAYVHEEACRWEHVMSEQVERRLVELLGHPDRIAVRQPDPGTRPAGRCPREASSIRASWVSSVISTRSAVPSRAPCAVSPSPHRSIPSCSSSSRPRASCPAARGSFRYSEGYVLVEMDGSDEALELPVEVAAHIFLVDERA